MTRLAPDAAVPSLSLPLVGGGNFTLGNPAPRNFTMVVFYRGHHCPVCKIYLETMNGLVDGYREAGFELVAASMNDKAIAEKTKAEWNIGNVPVAYGLTEAAARDWGLYVSKAIKEAEAELFCEPGLFWVRPDGRMYLGDVSNMPWARPDLAFLLSKVPVAVDMGYPARGTY